ncbi:MAG: hypothetical protein ACRD2I_27095, partial [Vicinamibacterales bacterium]
PSLHARRISTRETSHPPLQRAACRSARSVPAAHPSWVRAELWCRPATSANVQLWKGLGASMVFRRYSGYPINENEQVDTNGDGTNNDRPVNGRDDVTLAIRPARETRPTS